MIDVATGWSERVVVLGRGYQAMQAGFGRILERVPFAIVEVHPDNGSEFFTHHLLRFWKEKVSGVQFSRSRPYHKNDNRFVEQKNATLVRQYVGTLRLDTPEQVAALNAFYEKMWLYYNLFQPVLRLAEKRVGPEDIQRKWDEAQTPYQRLLATGTLTKNEMTVRAVVTPGGRVDFTGTGYDPHGTVVQAGQTLADPLLKDEVEAVLRAAYLVNNAELLYLDGKWTIQGDPTEGALLVAAQKVGLHEEDLEGHFPRRGEIPFSSERKLMSTVHEDSGRGEHLFIFSKGAPDVLLAQCTSEQVGEQLRLLSSERRAAILAEVERLAVSALRTISVAWRMVPREEIEGEGALGEHIEQELVWLGVIGMIDPPRPEAVASVQQAQQAGVRVIMITGDHPITAEAIARELGIIQEDGHAVIGTELARMSDEALRETIRTISVYARVAPEHKLRIVQALQANGEVVAMTGDGVNDAPALKRADIGVAMGMAGTDVAKDAADMILTDDNFASIVAAIEEGRSIFANIQKFLRYLLSSNIGEVLTMFCGVILASVIGLMSAAGKEIEVPLLATQILWINLLTDAGPALGLGVDPRDPRQMCRPPRAPRSHIISNTMWINISIVGVLTGGVQANIDFLPVLIRTARLQGIFVGSRRMLERVMDAVVEHRIKPVIDRAFPFDEALAAYRLMESGGHFGKIAIRV